MSDILKGDSSTVERAYAALARDAWLLVRHIEICYPDPPNHLGISRVEYLIRMMAETMRASPVACRCDPPGSGEEWCTGHCLDQAT